MTTKNLKSTKAFEKILKKIRDYQDYYKKAKGATPPIIRITKDQINQLGIDPGYKFNGSRLELSE